MYLAINNTDAVRAEVLKSEDKGLTWNLKEKGWYVPQDISNARDSGCKLATTPADPDRVYACLIGSSKEGDNGWIGVYYSLDGGDSWINPDGIDADPITLLTRSQYKLVLCRVRR